MSANNALEGFADVLLEFVAPLIDAVGVERELTEFLAGLGWSFPAIDLARVRTAATALVAALDDLRTGMAFETLQELAAALQSLTAATTAMVSFTSELVAAVEDAAAAGGVPASLAEALFQDLLQRLTVGYIGRAPAVYASLEIFGLIDEVDLPALTSGGDPPLLTRAAVRQVRLVPEVLGEVLDDPLAYLKSRFGVQSLTDQAVAERMLSDVFGPLAGLVAAIDGTGVVGTGIRAPESPGAGDREDRLRASLTIPLPSALSDGAALNSAITVVVELVHAGATSRTGDAGPGMLISPEGTLALRVTLPGSQLDIAVSGGAFSAFFPGSGGPVLHGAAGGVQVAVDFATVAPPGGSPAIVVGSDSLGLSIGGIRAGTHGRFGRADDPRLDVELTAGMQSASFRIAPAEGDGFLGKVLPADGIQFDFDLGVGWSNRRGLFFSGAAALEADIPLHASLLGVLTIDALHLRLAAGRAIELDVAATASLKLGPIAATVERMGLAVIVEPRTSGGNAGPFELRPAFIPPRGAGLVINASVVTGGGFILNDPKNGRYAGILKLKIGDVVVVTAIGLVTTKLPDGSRGFSLLIIITAEFPPIQLGFGFNLSGLGGLLGLNRTMNVQALRDGVRTGVLDSILFPIDPVARATKVISDIESVFPIAEGRFVIGLMARIGWGSPRLITIDLGLIVELPMPLRIALIGTISAILPKEDAAIIELHLDIVGILDLGRSELSIDATLHDSRVAVFDIYGDMALRLCWGPVPVFIVSVGGLNPRFERPPTLPELRRLTIALASSENPSVRLESYFAITSNSLQIGARLSAHVEVKLGPIGDFTADAWLGFDALIMIPFEFIVDIAGGVMIRRNGEPFLGASILLAISGPKPFRAVGYAELVFLGTHRLPIDVTVGEKEVMAVLGAIDPTGALLEAVKRIESWSAQPPRDAVGVTVRKYETNKQELRVHPMGELSLRQRVLPLDIRVERFGGAPVAGGPRNFTVGYRIGGSAKSGAALRDAWAPNDYFMLADDEKISRPSFEQLPSGHSGIGGAAVSFGPAKQGADTDYKTLVIDEDELARLVTGGYKPIAQVQAMLASLDESHRATGYAGPDDLAVSLAPQQYRLADTEKLAAQGGTHKSWIEAKEALGSGGGLQIVGAHEVSP